jgi:mevalonate kinase
MPAISATAPGKAILLGEHAVVYGQPAIAVPVIQVKARAIVSARPDHPRGWVGVQAPDIDLETTLPELPGSDPLSRVISGVLEATAIPQPPACTIRITATIPIAAGLGSGAAISVAIIRAFSEFLGRPLPNEKVSELAFEVEKVHHGTPSGIDNTVITYEKPVYFTKSAGNTSSQILTLQVAEPFTLVIGDSGISSPTALTVADVRQAWLEDGELYERLFSITGDLVKSARGAIENGDMPALGQLMDENQTMLEKMGVSSAELEQLIQAARQAGAYGAKLSGGGRGGNMIALAPEEAAGKISEALITAGATNTIVTVVHSQPGNRWQ